MLRDMSACLFAAIAEESPLRRRISAAVPEAVGAYHAMDFSVALNAVLSISGLANQYLAEKAPWTLLKKVSAHTLDSATMQLQDL